MTEAERAEEITDALFDEALDCTTYNMTYDNKGGPIFDVENGDTLPSNFSNGEGMYLGDGVWVSMDFFD